MSPSFLSHGLRDVHAAEPLPHLAPRAKNVIFIFIFIFMMGGPSHLDLFDPKPRMAALHGQPMPTSLLQANKSATGGVLETVMCLYFSHETNFLLRMDLAIKATTSARGRSKTASNTPASASSKRSPQTSRGSTTKSSNWSGSRSCLRG